MRLGGRVKRLERERLGGSCPRCRGVRPLVVLHEADAEPEPCPGCGREPHAIRIVPVREEGPEQAAPGRS